MTRLALTLIASPALTGPVFAEMLDRVISGEMDEVHKLAGQPLAATTGYGKQARIVGPFSMDLNGNTITVGNAVWQAMIMRPPTGAGGNSTHPICVNAPLSQPDYDADRRAIIDFPEKYEHGHKKDAA